MAVVRLEPVRELMSIQDRMNRMFDEAFRTGRDENQWSPGGIPWLSSPLGVGLSGVYSRFNELMESTTFDVESS